MLFYRFLSGRLIFLYGTSTSGKSSIADYIKTKAKANDIDLIVTGGDVAWDIQTLYRYFSYCPSDANLLLHYFTVDEIGDCIESPVLADKLIAEKSIIYHEAQAIQSAICRFRAKNSKLLQLFLEYSRYPNFCVREFLDALSSGKTVIADTVDIGKFIQVMEKQLLCCRIDVVVVYCPLSQLIKRLCHRNEEALKSSSLNNARPGTFFLEQYAQMYEPSTFPYQAIDIISFSDIVVPEKLTMLCRLTFERYNCDRFGQYQQESKWENTSILLRKSFGLYDDKKDKIFIKPKISYHFLVNTCVDELEKCGKNILLILKILE